MMYVNNIPYIHAKKYSSVRKCAINVRKINKLLDSKIMPDPSILVRTQPELILQKDLLTWNLLTWNLDSGGLSLLIF